MDVLVCSGSSRGFAAGLHGRPSSFVKQSQCWRPEQRARTLLLVVGSLEVSLEGCDVIPLASEFRWSRSCGGLSRRMRKALLSCLRGM